MALQPLDASRVNPLQGGPSFSLGNRISRAVWNLTWTLFASWTPPQMRFWRRFLLKVFGAQLGESSDVRGSARIWYPAHLRMEDRALLAERVICYNMAPISLGRGALVSQGAHLCAGSHDITSANFQLTAQPITIGPRAWIAAEAFVGPGVDVGEGAVLGARSVAFRSLDPWTVYGGNPAKPLKRRVLRDGNGSNPTGTI